MNCSLSKNIWKPLISALKSNPSNLTELDFRWNRDLQDLGFPNLCGFLESPDYRLQTLKLKDCSLSEIICKALSSSKNHNLSSLTQLDLSGTNLQLTGFLHLCGFLESPDCRLQTLRLKNCSLSEISCEVLGSVLKNNPSRLTELDLSNNTIQDSGFLHLRGFLESPDCRLQTLRLWDCSLSEISCKVLGSGKNNTSRLAKLDLSGNKIQDSGFLHLLGFLESPDCRLQTLRLENCSLSEISCRIMGSALKNNPSRLTELNLSWNTIQDSGFLHLRGFLESPDCRLQTLRLWNCSLSKISCAALISTLNLNPSHLKKLDLRNNNLHSSDVQQLQDLVKSPNSKLQTLRWEGKALPFIN
ncbi:NACHT, LRR and PYD domains-containing protein 12-like [Oryzias melastigma]|uniref:NACHT, LRR and PYD domains-containing protein 12-like n=1 Tax=Oryzias melastigma TaxID=30732 RepID=UPI00168CBF2B|nr:NACHT, LRR and PYD domains-containing protein 12-like [Oryzias melastigma]